MPESQWPGLVTNASPFAIPPTAAVEQVNLSGHVPGQVSVRGGMRKVATADGSPEVLDCFPLEVDGKPALVGMRTNGSLALLESPAYGWMSRVPYEPDLTSPALLTTSYTYRYVGTGEDTYNAPDPDYDPGGGGGDDGCEAALSGGSAYTQAWDHFLDASSCEPSSPDPVADGGSASGVADCSQSTDFVVCGDDPLPPPNATIPTPPRNLVATFGSESASLAWDVPSSDGGSPVIDYEWNIATGTSDDPAALPSAPSAASVAWGATSATVSWQPGAGGGSVIDYDLEQQSLVLPDAPTSLSATLSSDPSIPNTAWYWALGWTPPSTAAGPLTGFRVYRNGELWLAAGFPGGVFPPNTLGVALGNAIWANGDTARVSAMNAAGEGPKSGSVTLSTTWNGP